MAQYEWSEIFTSIEGEGPYSGNPTVYIRFARCNFSCKGFNNPEKLDTENEQVLGFNPKDFKRIQDIPLIKRGCDSIYSWSDKFSHMWNKGDEKELAAQVLKVLPHNTFKNPVTGKRVILSLTGGEPTIRLKFWIPILEELYQHGMRSVLVETNCAAPMRQKDLVSLVEWQITKNKNMQVGFGADSLDAPVTIIWSNSPKLRSSGEDWQEAIRPEIAIKQISFNEIEYAGVRSSLLNLAAHHTEQYFKFVCNPTEQDFDEVTKAMNAYYEIGISKQTDVYCMPVACTTEQQDEISSKVAKMCIERGYIYCHRIQMIFGNGVGT